MNEESPMTALNIAISEWHFGRLREFAARENMTPDQLAAQILGEAIAQTEFFELRAARSSREKFLAALAKVPDAPPLPPDFPVR
jgi:hypothetical protein